MCQTTMGWYSTPQVHAQAHLYNELCMHADNRSSVWMMPCLCARNPFTCIDMLIVYEHKKMYSQNQNTWHRCQIYNGIALCQQYMCMFYVPSVSYITHHIVCITQYAPHTTHHTLITILQLHAYCIMHNTQRIVWCESCRMDDELEMMHNGWSNMSDKFCIMHWQLP